MSIIALRAEISPGTGIREAARQAIALAAQLDCSISFEHNGYPITVAGKDRTADIVSQYNRHLNLEMRIEKLAGGGR